LKAFVSFLYTERAVRLNLKSLSDTFSNPHVHFLQTAVASPTMRNTKTRIGLKGSRKLQNFDFSGGIISGNSFGGGVATITGSTDTMDDTGSANSAGNATFTSNSGSSGFIYSPSGAAIGSTGAGATGSQVGSVDATLGTGALSFDGTTTSSGTGGFGAGFSPVNFNAVTTEIPGTAIMIKGSPKKGVSSGFSDPTFVTSYIPVSTGDTGGFGTGMGALDVQSTTTGTLSGDANTIGTGSVIGTGTTFGGGEATGFNYFGKAGGLGSGTATGGDTALGNTAADAVGGTFTGTGAAVGDFFNSGFGTFGGASGILSFPFPVP
jgi:hypothetical protein